MNEVASPKGRRKRPIYTCKERECIDADIGVDADIDIDIYIEMQGIDRDTGTDIGRDRHRDYRI